MIGILLKRIMNQSIGYNKRITRQALCRVLRCSDSALRIEIGKLRLTGFKIVSHHGMEGYFKMNPQTATQEDYRHHDAMTADLATKIKTQQSILESQAIDQFRLMDIGG